MEKLGSDIHDSNELKKYRADLAEREYINPFMPKEIFVNGVKVI